MSEWRYIPSRHASVVHALGGPMSPVAFCGVEVAPSSEWRGTGSQAEYERAATLPRCSRCLALINHKRPRGPHE
jgi:hypothetical protein